MILKLKSKKKELDISKIRLKEKDQERRLGNLKLKELRRIIKQHKLKPLLSHKERPRRKEGGRNRSLVINQSNPVIDKSNALTYGNDAPEDTPYKHRNAQENL